MCFDSLRGGGGERPGRGCNVCVLTVLEEEVEKDLDEVPDEDAEEREEMEKEEKRLKKERLV